MVIINGVDYGNITRAQRSTAGYVDPTGGRRPALGAAAPTEKTAEELAAERNAAATLDATLREYGLQEMSGWALQMIQQGKSPAEILNLLRQTPQYKARFPGMALRQQNGYAPISEREYIEYERTVKYLFAAYGVPKGFYDDRMDIADLLGNKDLSAPELQFRIERGYAQVANASASIRNTFAEWYGPDGDSALAMFFLDPDKAQPVLERYVGTGSIGGTSRQIGVNLQKAKAEALYDLGHTSQSVVPRLGDLFARRSLFEETVTERDDFTLEETGVNAAFDLNPEDAGRLARRLEERVATTRGGGQAAIGREATGFGGARR